MANEAITPQTAAAVAIKTAYYLAHLTACHQACSVDGRFSEGTLCLQVVGAGAVPTFFIHVDDTFAKEVHCRLSTEGGFDDDAQKTLLAALAEYLNARSLARDSSNFTDQLYFNVVTPLPYYQVVPSKL